MLHEAMRTIGFLCPACRQAVIVERSAFQLAASQSAIECPCGESKLELSLQNDKIRIQAPCLLCDSIHSLSCSTHAFLHEKAIAFSCAATGLDCCYVGEHEAVFRAMERLEESVDALEREASGKGVFMNELVMGEILEELRDIASREAIACSCGSKQFGISLSFSCVELTCAHCGAALKIPATSLSDIEDLCCKTNLLIKGKKS